MAYFYGKCLFLLPFHVSSILEFHLFTHNVARDESIICPNITGCQSSFTEETTVSLEILIYQYTTQLTQGNAFQGKIFKYVHYPKY